MAASMRNISGGLSKLFCRIRVPIYYKNTSPYQCYSTKAVEQTEVEYPPVKPKFPPGKQWSDDIPLYKVWKQYNTEQNLLKLTDVRERLETISEKDVKIMMIQSFDKNPRSFEIKKHLTRTKEVKGLPEMYSDMNVEADYEKLKPILIDAILLEHEFFSNNLGRKRLAPYDKLILQCNRLISSIIDTILIVCTHNHKHLANVQVDNDVRVETCWKVNGFDYDINHHLGRAWMQYKGKRLKQIRTELPLPEFLPMDDELCSGGDLPVVDYSPFTCGFYYTRARPFTIAGHWIGDPCEFAHVAVDGISRVYNHASRKFSEKPDIMEGVWEQCGLISAFANCAAQAHNLGFNVYTDVTYPITTQTVITDGSSVQFFTYQLNTLHMWQKRDANPRNNIVWVGNKYKLFDCVEDGKVQGFNDEAFVNLLKFLLLKPVDRGYDLRPYISEEHAAANKKQFINMKGEEPLNHEKIGRFQYPRNAIYF